MVKKPLTLPIIVLPKNKYIFGVFLGAFSQGLYSFTNHNPVFKPITLPLTYFDLSAPFVPASIWIYLSEFVMFVLIYALMQNALTMTRYFYSMIAMQSMAAIVFIFYPTHLPRTDFPLQGLEPSYTIRLFEWLRSIDAETNCLPSLHVACCFLSCFVFLQEQKEKFPVFLTWVILVSISTLTTKQHYFLDVVAGFFFASTSYYFFTQVIHYRTLPGKEPKL